MKNFLLLGTFLLLFLSLSQGQSVTITSNSGGSPYEVGIPYNFTATLNNTAAIQSVEKYVWTVDIGATGPSGIMGELGPGNVANYTVFSTQMQNTVNVRFGDAHGTNGNAAKVKVHITDTSGVKRVLSITLVTNLALIKAPDIVGAHSLQACCEAAAQYQATNVGAANRYNWSVANASPNGPTTNSTLTINPARNGNVDLTCTVSRSTASPLYTRTATRTIVRHQPVTPTLQGPGFLCIGEQTTFSLEDICGAIEALWVFDDPSLVEIINQDAFSITVQPVEVGEISLTSSLVMHDCANTAPKTRSLQIFSPDEFEKPEGWINVILDPDFDPCDDYILNFQFMPTTPFTNGFITVTPSHFIGVPHHINGSTITVTVCYFNPCTGIEKCTEFEVDLPEPCDDDPRRGLVREEENGKTHYRLMAVDKSVPSSALVLAPNPATNQTSITFPKPLESIGMLRLVDLSGKVHQIQALEPGTENTKIILQQVPTGIYIVQILADGMTHNLRLVKS